jgi:hypothetical protein
MQLRMDVHESVLYQEAGLQYMIAMAALHAHEDANFAKAGALVSKMYFDAMGFVPYMTEGRTGEDMVNEERKKAIKRFEEYRNATITDMPKR